MNTGAFEAVNGTAVFGVDGINIRYCPRPDCPVVGQAFTGQQAVLICSASGDPVNGCDLWYLLTNVDTGVTGYVAVGAARFAELVWTNPTDC